MIPYIGDAAKLGKFGKWSKTIDRAIDVALLVNRLPHCLLTPPDRPSLALSLHKRISGCTVAVASAGVVLSDAWRDLPELPDIIRVSRRV
jgi:hypothetical protein